MAIALEGLALAALAIWAVAVTPSEGLVAPMQDSRTCHGHERATAKCDELPPCETPCEKVDCSFGEWGEWQHAQDCSGLCHRHRSIKAANNECGAPCEGPTTESRRCEPKSGCVAPREDCAWSDWGEWTPCLTELDQRYRHRSAEPPAHGFGRPCAGSLNETAPCNEVHIVNCEFGEWGPWTPCSASCGGGFREQIRAIHVHARHGGRPCDGTTRQTAACNAQECDGTNQDCDVGAWTEWRGCGFESPMQRFRSREVSQPARGAGKTCTHAMKETAGCEDTAAQDCEFGGWSDWSTCDQTCGGGQTYRRRSFLRAPSHGGTCGAAEELAQMAPCSTQACEHASVCFVSIWGEWSACSATCGRGVQHRERQLVLGSQGRRLGSFLDDMADSLAAMATDPDERPIDCRGGFSGPLAEVTACDAMECLKQDCAWGRWGEWSACTATCGGGTKRRNRVVAVPPSKGGRACEAEDKSEIAPCGTQGCDVCVNGTWMEWSSWTVCSATCGVGFRKRSRDIAQHPNYCGIPVSGVEDDYETCRGAACVAAVDCVLSEWSAWSNCSRQCFGVSERHRTVATQAEGDGVPCSSAALKEIAQCNPGSGQEAVPDGCLEQPARACVLGAWQEWGACTESCGGGQRLRSRDVLMPAQRGGEPCSDDLGEISPCNTAPCSKIECVDCVMGGWSDWGACSRCDGQRFRHRSVKHPPNHCGEPCPTEGIRETSSCNLDCNQERWCAWTEWSTFGECSAHCGVASKVRSRSLRVFDEEPRAFLFVGLPEMVCAGTQVDTRACPFRSCSARAEAPVDCAFGQWSEWSAASCTQLCERTRVIETVGKSWGAACEGPLVVTKRCPKDCDKDPVDCELSEWGQWSHCPSREQQRYRKRTTMQPATNGGRPCQGDLAETQLCSDPGLPQPCELESWSEWSECTKRCLGGVRSRRRLIRKPAANGGAPCDGNLEELGVCNTGKCEGEVRRCDVSEWGEWSACGDNAQKMRSRSILQQPQNGGAACSASLQEMASCNAAVDCEVSEWSAWDVCDKSCGGGQQLRHRQVVKDPRHGGQACPSALMETRGCGRTPCNKRDCEVSEWGSWGACSATCGQGQQARARRVTQLSADGGEGCRLATSQLQLCAGLPSCGVKDCVWGQWSAWSDCTSPCDGGQRNRNRRIAQSPDIGGKPCEPLAKEEVVPCNMHKCKSDLCVDGEWAAWGAWEPCSSTCSGGVTWRTRQVLREANFCGLPPTGPAREHASCHEDVRCEPDVDCEFHEWGAWTDCSAVCSGVMARTRTIKTHGRGNGQYCFGKLQETSPCNPGPGEEMPAPCRGPAPVDCVVSHWASWSRCTSSCGGGSHTRKRMVLTEPSHGGKPCEESLSVVEGCNGAPCDAVCVPEDCAWSSWEAWSACDKCGGQMKRNRHVMTMPACGGIPCEPQAAEETRSCTRQCHEPLHCAWGEWEDWGACSATCGSGEQSRVRHLALTSAAPHAGLLGSATGLDEMPLEDSVRRMREQSRSLQHRRLQELVLAFVGGGVTLIAGLWAFRSISRARRIRRRGGRPGVAFSPLPDEVTPDFFAAE